MAGAAPTIPSLKQSFITTQTTILAQPLAPSRTWNAANDASEQPVPERAVQDALFHLNHSVQQHGRRIYAPQASRNIAEQINSVYTKDAERRAEGDGDVEGGIGRELDLTDGDSIEVLPPAWISDKDVTNYPMEAKRYADAVQQLMGLNEKRKQLKEQVARLSRLKVAVEPLRTSDGGVGVQENIVTRNGVVEQELERMRFLLARVGGRVHALPDLKERSDFPRDFDLTETGGFGLGKRRVDQFLEDQNVFP
ncbi:Fc.00g103350.m01.CDS01 [Cosmosporella sp. VM-42]